MPEFYIGTAQHEKSPARCWCRPRPIPQHAKCGGRIHEQLEDGVKVYTCEKCQGTEADVSAFRPEAYSQEKTSNPYAGSLASFGDATIDALAATQRDRKVKERQLYPSRCPGCGNVRILTKVYSATICQECHDDISERAAKKPDLTYEPAFVGF